MSEHGWTAEEDLAFRRAAGEDVSSHPALHVVGENAPAANTKPAQPGLAVEPVAEGDWPVLRARRLPAFPVDALPSRMAAWVEAVAVESQTPPDLAALAALGVLSAAAMGSATVDCGSWTEELTLYLLTVLPPAERKSTVLKAALTELRRLERESRDAAAPGVREERTRLDVLEKRKAALTKQVASESDPGARREAEGELTAADEEIAKIGEPVPPRLLADDATAEALARLLSHHGSIAVVSAESALVDNICGRYSEGNSNLHLVCQSYNGESTVVDRAKGDAEQIDRPLLTIALAVQPHVLQKLVAHETARAQGLVARFAYAMPTTAVGTRKIYDVPGVPDAVRQEWESIVRRVYENPKTHDKYDKTPKTPSSVISVMDSGVPKLILTASARTVLYELMAELEPRLGPKGDLQSVGDWGGRLHGRVARIAGLLHVAERPLTEPIGEGTMRNARRIGDYLLAHSVEALIGADPLTRRAIDWLREHGNATVTERDLHRGPAQAGDASGATALAEALERVGALRALPKVSGKPGRPSSPAYEVHPELTTKR